MSSPLHPVLWDMLQLGCKNASTVGHAFQIYMELSEVQGCWDVQYSYNSELDLIYFKTLNKKSQKLPDTVVPWPIFKDISPAQLNKITTTLIEASEEKVITLALKDSDSSVLFYKVYADLKEPMSLEESQQVKTAEEKKRLTEVDLRKSRSLLYESVKADSLDKE